MAKTSPQYQADGGEGRILKATKKTLSTVKTLLDQQSLPLSLRPNYIYDMDYITVQKTDLQTSHYILIHFSYKPRIYVKYLRITTNQLEHIPTNLYIHVSYLDDLRNLKIYNIDKYSVCFKTLTPESLVTIVRVMIQKAISNQFLTDIRNFL